MPDYTKLPDANDAHASLDQWERALTPHFWKIRLLGELPLDNAQRKELARAMRDIIRLHGLTRATRIFKKHYPRSFLAYLALTASRNEERGFWKVVAKEMGLTNEYAFFNPNHHWGKLFEELLPRFSLDTFPDIVTNTRYVTRIRLHGGIPAYSLPDFFNRILLHAVHDLRYAGLTAPEIIERMLERADVQQFVDSPVRYFFEYGGQTAEEFLERTMIMAQAWEDENRTLTAAELELPRYVVSAFQQFMEGRLETPHGKRLRWPRLQLTPTDNEYLFSLALPEQPVDTDRAGWTYRWQIILHTESGEKKEIETLTVRKKRRRGAAIITEFIELDSMDLSPGQLRIAFMAREPEKEEPETLGRWYFDLTPPPGELPVLAFRSYNGRPVRQDATLPADVLWLLLPADLEVRPLPDGRMVEQPQELGGVWSAWKIELWDLRNARLLELNRPGTDEVVHTIPIRPQPAAPHLLHDTLMEADLDIEEQPLFIGPPPRLWLPRLTDRPLDSELSKWQVLPTLA